MKYDKQPLDIPALLAMLKARGLTISDEQQPDLPKRLRNAWIKDTNTPFNKLYAQLCCMAYWYNAIDPQNTFTADIKELLLKYPIVDPAAMGFVKNWQDEPLWK